MLSLDHLIFFFCLSKVIIYHGNISDTLTIYLCLFPSLFTVGLKWPIIIISWEGGGRDSVEYGWVPI